jgi:hypothetical protein
MPATDGQRPGPGRSRYQMTLVVPVNRLVIHRQQGIEHLGRTAFLRRPLAKNSYNQRGLTCVRLVIACQQIVTDILRRVGHRGFGPDDDLLTQSGAREIPVGIELLIVVLCHPLLIRGDGALDDGYAHGRAGRMSPRNATQQPRYHPHQHQHHHSQQTFAARAKCQTQERAGTHQ